jgi:UDP-galactopyranose mutase
VLLRGQILKKNNIVKPDVLIIGAGPVGCVLAERFSNIDKLTCLIIDQRNHIAGNCYDKKNKKNLLYHQYGPHYLRFKKKKLFFYLSKFTKWIKGNYIVNSIIDGKKYPFPINITTLEKFFKKKFNSKKELISFLNKKKINIKRPKNSEELILSKLGKEIYESFYKNYTLKQWGIHPKNLSKDIVGRIPIRFNRNNKYVNEKIQVMPKNGYTEMFKKMISNDHIRIKLNTSYEQIKNQIKPNILTIYTGCPDIYFDYKYGKLSWRSLKFSFKTYKEKFKQSCVQYNYPNDYKYTRTVEIKHVTKQKSNYTIISKEYPSSSGQPYYPINNKINNEIFAKYSKLIRLEEKKNVFFEGRLASYKYLNTDQVIEKALNLHKKIQKKILKKNANK